MSTLRSSRANAALALLVMLLFPLALQAEESAKSDSADTGQVELFAALRDGKIAVTVIPRNSEKLTMQIENKTDAPLTIQAPAAFAAVPVAAQFGGGNNGGAGFFGNNGLGNGNQGNQAVGAGMNGGNGIGNGAGLGNGVGFGNGAGLNGGGIFNVPAGKTIKRRIDCVCLNHGKPEPRPRIPYEIRPLDEVVSNPGVGEVLQLLAQNACTQRVAQLAAWHLANDKSWDELAQMEGRHVTGQRYPLYSQSELKQAQYIVKRLPSLQEKPTPSTTSLSQR